MLTQGVRTSDTTRYLYRHWYKLTIVHLKERKDTIWKQTNKKREKEKNKTKTSHEMGTGEQSLPSVFRILRSRQQRPKLAALTVLVSPNYQ